MNYSTHYIYSNFCYKFLNSSYLPTTTTFISQPVTTITSTTLISSTLINFTSTKSSTTTKPTPTITITTTTTTTTNKSTKEPTTNFSV